MFLQRIRESPFPSRLWIRHYITLAMNQEQANDLTPSHVQHLLNTLKRNMARTKQTARSSTAPTTATVVSTDGLGPAGTKSEWKRIDEVYDAETRKYIFRDSAPFSSKENEDSYRDFCFVVKKKYDYNTPTFTTTIVIKSLPLRDACSEVIGVIPPVSFHTAQVEIPPRVLLTFYPALCDHLEGLKKNWAVNELVINQLGLLVDFIQTEHAAQLERLAAFLEHDEITFDLLWAILLPGKEYYTIDRRTGQPRAVILKWATEGCSQQTGPYYSLDCEYLESFGESMVGKDRSTKQNNKKFGRATHTSIIWGFQGAVKINSLAIFPMEYHHKIDEVRKMLITRGKKWAAYDGMHHVSYSGIAYQTEGKRIYINGRAMVDKATFRRIKPNWHPMGLPKNTAQTTNYDEDDEEYDEEYNGNSGEDGVMRPVNGREQRLSDDDYILATPIVYGFALEDKEWVEFNIDLVETIVWNDTAFANLVLAAEKKALIQALVEAHGQKDRFGFDDFIIGKGQGLVINLFGPPGVGKTMSAEATSEHLRKPLYVVGAGHLGTSASSLDTSLNEIFDIAHAWNAVVLIDEADVFLEERSVHDIQRNALVAVFLRQLEYFAGILFLTTNRVSTFDDAFQSRIHVALRYRDLDQETRATIWRAFLGKVGAAERISDSDWEKLITKEVNGRQIKNAVRTAQALAHSKKEDLMFAHVSQVLSVMEAFESDMKALKA